MVAPSLAESLDAVAAELKSRGYYVARHSYSYMLIERGSYAASLHIYPLLGKATLRVQASGEGADRLVTEAVSIVERCFPGIEVEVVRV